MVLGDCCGSFHHSDTVLPKRFPIGLERLVRNFNSSDFETFYRRHYHPANMCLYVTGDIDVSDMEAKIEQV
jgi:predicted Zn-dependent peptidase